MNAATAGDSPRPSALLPQHRALIEGSAISFEIAAERGYRSVTKKVELRDAGFGESQRLVPALLIPIYSVTGELVLYQSRPDLARVVGGKVVKYETPRGFQIRIDVPRRCLREGWLDDPTIPVFVTEGARKADAGVSAGLFTIAVLGVWNWRGSNDQGGKTLLADWESIALNGRDVYIVFDSDVMTKRSVYLSLVRLKAVLESRKAHVRVIYLAPGKNGQKVGLDDFFGAGGNVADLLRVARDEIVVPDGSALTQPSSGPYFVRDGATYFRRRTRDGDVDEQLANFTATIVGDTVEDDGAEHRRLLTLSGTLGGHTKDFDVAVEAFESGRWATEQLGPKATIAAGFGNRDRFRESIQRLSPNSIPSRTVFRHLGWREVGGRHVYLHAGGAIGAEGVVADIQVRVDAPLDRFVLPAPPVGEELRVALRGSLKLFDGLAPDSVMFPLFSITWTTVVVPAVESVHVTGPTGGHKTEIAALCQRHYGASMTADKLPASWSSTANALEALGFLAKDALLVIDDFCPSGTMAEVNSQARAADRVFRGRGNSAGRVRSRTDGTPRPSRPPRAAVLSTGEDVPPGHSLRARMLVVELGAGEVDLEVLTQRQGDGDLYAKAMAGFVAHVAQHRASILSDFNSGQAALRARLVSVAEHGRTANAAAHLLCGLQVFLRFAEQQEAIDAGQAAALRVRAEQAFVMLVNAQRDHQQGSDPVLAFVNAISSALMGGDAHLADHATGGKPSSDNLARVAGWRRSGDEGFQAQWRAMGSQIGWIDFTEIYLLPSAAYRVAQKHLDTSPIRISITERTLWKRLVQAGLVASHDRGRNTLKLRVLGRLTNVLHLDASLLLGESGTSGTTGTTADEKAVAAELFPKTVPDFGGTAAETGTPNGNTNDREFGDEIAEQDGLGQRRAPPPRPCYVCGGGRLWRLSTAAHWNCCECTPPNGTAVVEYSDVCDEVEV